MKLNDVVAIVGSDENRVNAYVREIGSENITLDLNHPLAGNYVQFSVILRGIE